MTVAAEDYGMAVAEYVSRNAPGAEAGAEGRWSVKLDPETGRAEIERWELPIPEPTEGELEAALLAAKKAAKVAELHAAALEELNPLFTEGAGENELAFVLAAHIKSILGAQADPRLAEVERVGTKALAKKAKVEAATTPEELEAISWTA